jgi:hypothetical protein
LLGGPATATFNGHTFFAWDGIVVTPALETADTSDCVNSDAEGMLDETVSGGPVTIKFTPSAPFADLIALYPYMMGSPGMPLFGATDTPLVLVAANGTRLTFSAAAIVEMPDLCLGASEPVTGAVTFLAIGARSMPIAAANRLVTIDSAAVPLMPFAPPQLSDDFIITWGLAPWVKLRARDGVRVHFAMKTSPVISAANGLLDLTLDSLAVEVRFAPATPNGPAEADIFDALGMSGAPAGGLPGRLVSAEAQTLDVAGDHVWLRLPLARMTRGALVFDAKHSRVGELVFTAGRALLGAESATEALVTLTEGEP